MKRETLEIFDDLIKNYSVLSYLKEDIIKIVQEIIHRVKKGSRIYVCGNGGSAADSEHIVGELVKEFYIKRPLNKDFANKIIQDNDDLSAKKIISSLQEGVRAFSLVSQTGLSTAYSNDVAPEMVFAQQLYVYGEEGDVLIGLSTSGNSENILLAFKVAKAKGIYTIAFTGDTGGKVRDYSDGLINVPSNETYRIQEYHLPIYHAMCKAIEMELYGE